MKQFQNRSDNQIMTLEILTISFGLSTFAAEVQNRNVVVFSDNTAAEASSRKGSASSWDHCQLIHEIWSHCLCKRTHIWIERVASEFNLSDLPSRGEHTLVKSQNAEWREPVIAKLYYDAKAVMPSGVLVPRQFVPWLCCLVKCPCVCFQLHGSNICVCKMSVKEFLVAHGCCFAEDRFSVILGFPKNAEVECPEDFMGLCGINKVD